MSPSSSISVQATGAGNDSPITMSRPAVTHMGRKSSRIEAWLSEQHRIVHTNPGDPTPVAKSIPYVVYPEPSGELVRQESVDSFVVVSERGGSRRSSRNASVSTARSPGSTPHPSPPSTPRKLSPFRAGPRRFASPSPLRNFHLSFHSRRPSTSSGVSRAQGSALSAASARGDSSAPRSSSGWPPTRAPLLSEHTEPSEHHASSWLKSPSAWKLKRAMEPTASAMESDEPQSRPSLSSTVTRSSVTSNAGRTSLETPSTSRKVPGRAQTPSVLSGTSPSLWSLPTDASHMYDPPDSEKVLARDREKAGSIRIPLSLKMPSANTPSFGSVSAALASPRHKRKRKLIISGIPYGDERRFEAVKKWCESFGEVNAISREPNGHLYVDFRKAEVAETVCRLQARVYIKGVGSVCLSYFTGKKP
ncbi:hypothetical protein C8Q72DRAFT_427587 [Fomitopsis betulina]|nr:hypothetical protein C8Q72DRAFT_427587 [Fomitopsis betulina]